LTDATHALVARFFADLGAGRLDERLFTPDATVWTLTSATDNPAARYCHGTKVLVSLFPQGLVYTVHSITAEEDRAAVEVTAHGVLADGTVYDNHYVMLFRIRDGRIVRLAEYFDRRPVESLITPRLMAAMAKREK
jgi:ketosteroid isomerase-like protein